MLTVTLVSDFICPWCWLGYARLLKAIEAAGRDDVEIQWWPFELNPGMPPEGMERRAYRTAKFGSWDASRALDDRLTALGREDGLDFRFERSAVTPSTRLAHRLTTLVHSLDRPRERALAEAIYAAYFRDGADIGNRAVLARLLAQAGVEGRDDILARLDAGDATEAVEEMERRAQAAGVSGVPLFLIGDRPVSGAQPVEVLARTLSAVE